MAAEDKDDYYTKEEADSELLTSNLGWKGKVVSVLGDSISTFEDMVPVADGHNLTHRVRYSHSAAPWYFSQGGTVDDTYWMRVINKLGAKLGILDTWAGSRVHNSSDTDSGDQGPNSCMASITRITNLGSNGTPDLILYYGGTNDCGGGITLGSFDSTATYTTDLTTKKWANFATAYKDSIMRLQYYYPFAKILVMLPMYCTNYYTLNNLDKYNEVIKEICDYFGVEYIDFRRCGVNSQNLGTTLGDGIHPTKEGFHLMGDYLYNKLISMYSNDGVENVVYSVTNTLTTNTNTDRYIKGVSAGHSYEASITGPALASIIVTMNNIDITSTTYNASTGKINISSVTGNIVVSESQVTVYTITTNVSNGSSTGATSIVDGGTATVTIVPSLSATLPSTVTVTGASYTYDSTTGVISLSNPTNNITVTAVCESGGEVIWYTNESMSGTSIPAATGYGWAPIVNLTGQTVDVMKFRSAQSSGVMEVGLGTLNDSTATQVQTINWTSTDKDANDIVTVRIPSAITPQANQFIIVFPETQPGDGAFLYGGSSGGSTSGFYTDCPVSRRGQSSWREAQTGSLGINFGHVQTSGDYTITTTVTNGTYIGNSFINQSGIATITVTPNSGYDLPSSVNVTGATQSYNSTTGVITLSNPTDNVTVTVVCPAGDIWYTNEAMSGTTSVNTGGYGWSPSSSLDLVGQPINLVKFKSSNASGSFEIGKAIYQSSTYSDVQTVAWDSSNKDGDIVTIELPNTLTLDQNENIVVYPATQPETDAFLYRNSGSGTTYFWTDCPVSRRGSTAWNQTGAGMSLQINFGYRAS